MLFEAAPSRRMVTRTSVHGAVDLGHEPPINIDGGTRNEVDRRALNVRWLSGTVLTGFCGALLMVGAMGASIDRMDRRAMTPEIVQPPAPRVSTASERLTNAARKADKITPLSDAFSTTKQVLRIPMSVKVGDKEIFRVRPHTRVAADLAQTLSGSYDIPAFNPLKLMTGDTAVEAETTTEAAQEAEATVVMRDLAAVKIDSTGLMEIPPGDVLIRVREAALVKALSQPNAVAAPATDVPINENNTLMVLKSPTQSANTSRSGERVAQAKNGDTVANLLIEQGASRDDARAIANIIAKDGRSVALKEGQSLRTLFTPSAGGKLQPARIVLSGTSGIEAQVALSDMGRYVAVGEQNPLKVAKLKTNNEEEAEEEEDDTGTGIRLYSAIYESAMRQEMPKAIIDELIRLYAQDIDFNKRVTPGDRFEVFYVSDEEGDGGRGDILYAAISVAGEMHRYYRFQPKDDTMADFYDEKGKSVRKFLLRKPIAGGTLRSTFGMRRHPILRYLRLHSGVDWADRVGTPIVAAGNGSIIKAGWSSGYGRRVEIEHANGYVTTYNHMSGFAKGITEGARVRQGQVVGFLGNSGLSTGPHLHYEVYVNDQPVDPLSIRVPRGRELEGRTLVEFSAERDRINQVMNRDPATSRLSASARQ